MADARGRGIRDSDVGGLVQSPTAARTDRRMSRRPSTKHATMSRLPSPDSHNSLSHDPGTAFHGGVPPKTRFSSITCYVSNIARLCTRRIEWQGSTNQRLSGLLNRCVPCQVALLSWAATVAPAETMRPGGIDGDRCASAEGAPLESETGQQHRAILQRVNAHAISDWNARTSVDVRPETSMFFEVYCVPGPDRPSIQLCSVHYIEVHRQQRQGRHNS